MTDAPTPRDVRRPAHNHPRDSICLLIACPRSAWDAALTRREPLDVERLAEALQMYAQIGNFRNGGIAPDHALEIAREIAAEYARLETADKP